jgi:hypothetical protein
VPPLLRRPGSDDPVDLADHPLEAGLIRLAVLGARGFELAFDDPAVVAAARACLTRSEDEEPFDAEALRPLAARGLDELERAAGEDERLARLLRVWRPRALLLAGRARDVTGEDRLRLRLEERLASLAEQLEAAKRAGHDDLAEALHARYIELGTTYAGRLARSW